MKLTTIVGARPQFIKAAAITRNLTNQHQERLVHTGQHYDHGMSQAFFDELDIPAPDINLGIAGGSHGAQTGAMLAAIERVLVDDPPDCVVVYGDTNSTLAGALAASKLHLPVAHVEAGLRSFDKAMPEEINRILTDHVSRWLFCPTDAAVENLRQENITQGVIRTGDIMKDTLLYYLPKALASSTILADHGISADTPYVAVTLHRPQNVDDRDTLDSILNGLAAIGIPVIWPLHPRTRQRLQQFNLPIPPSITAIDPVSYFDMLTLVHHAALLITDSGGLQKEAYILQTPCITVRPTTEWMETVTAGWNTLCPTDTSTITYLAQDRIAASNTLPHPNLYGDGNTATLILDVLAQSL